MLLIAFLMPLPFFFLFFDVKRLACLLQITLLVLKKTSFLKNTLSGRRCPPMNWRNPPTLFQSRLCVVVGLMF